METKNLEVVLKLTERCNIDCKYCYVFNGVDDSYKTDPPILSHEGCIEVASYLRQACKELNLEKLQIDFHGGEPMLIGKRRFAKYCEIFNETVGTVVDLSLAIQTNATLIDAEWIDLFIKYNVSPGVSLDGNKLINDKNRIDFKGRGTYDKTVFGLDLLKSAYDAGEINSLGVLCVIDPENSAKDIYQHFVHDLGIKTMDFLLPDLSYDTIGTRDTTSDGKFLCELFDCWVEDDNPEIFIRTLNSIMSLLMGGRSKVIGFGQEVPLAVGISTNGTVGPDDTLRSCGTDFYTTSFNVSDSTLVDFIASNKMSSILKAGQSIPDSCKSCCWETTCGGGHLIHRYSKLNQFENPSVLCNGLKTLYAHIAAYLVNNGLHINLLKKNLKLIA